MIREVGIARIEPSARLTRIDGVVIEEPLEIRVEGEPLTITMRTPGNDRELAAGFLLSEGIVARREQIFDIVQCPSSETENVVEVTLTDPGAFQVDSFRRNVLTTASCGLCGRATLEQLHQRHPPVSAKWSMVRDALLTVPDALRATQSAFERTGGLHAAALFGREGKILAVREDIGRHNAVDKLLGAAFFDGLLPMSDVGLIVSGRVSFEIVQKARAAGLPCVAAIGAASSLAIEAAVDGRQTLVGFLRENRMNVYHGEETIH